MIYRGGHIFDDFNTPIETPDHPTKSHAVVALVGDTDKLIRFGQQGVEGSPPHRGESEANRKRREAWYARHALNIARGPLSAAWWAAKVKW